VVKGMEDIAMTTSATSGANVHVRWLIRRDMDQMLAIENASFEYPWPDEDFVNHLRQRNCIGMVAELNDCSGDGQVVGYMIYELHRQYIKLLNFAVAPDYRRKGIGSKMLEQLFAKLSRERRSRITLGICERNMDGLLFFREMGFRAIGLDRVAYRPWCDDDAVVMVYRYGQPIGSRKE
jgi:ribosomal-protein-alanine N-acetyltransferase